MPPVGVLLKKAKSRNMQTAPHDSPWKIVLWCRQSRKN